MTGKVSVFLKLSWFGNYGHTACEAFKHYKRFDNISKDLEYQNAFGELEKGNFQPKII